MKNKKASVYKKIKTRKSSMEFLLTIFVSALVLVTGTILSVTIYTKSSSLLHKQVQINALNVAKSAAASIDGETFAAIPAKGENSAEFKEIKKKLSVFRDNSAIEYIYSFRLNNQEQAVFVVDTDKEDPEKNGAKYKMLPEMQKAFDGKATADKEVSTDEWGSYLSGYAPVFDGENVVGIVGVDISYSSVQKELNQLKLIIALISIVILLLMFFGIFYISRKLRGGFNILNDKVCELSDGEGDLNREVQLNSGDEFEVIAASINGFIRQVRKMVEEVAIKSVNSEGVILDMNGNVGNLNSSMAQCVSMAENISAGLSVTAERVAKLADTVADADASVAKATKEASDSSDTARERKETAINDIAKMKESIRKASEQAKAVEEVRKVTAEIDKFATQIRILSLNAQVEASRAGEGGVGFAVVAGEMHLLNEKITESVGRISRINEAVFEGVNELLSGTDEMETYLTNSVLSDYDNYAQVGMAYGETVEKIHQTMEGLRDSAKMISEEVMQADADLANITHSIAGSNHQIAEISMASATIAHDMKELTEEPMLLMVQDKHS